MHKYSTGVKVASLLQNILQVNFGKTRVAINWIVPNWCLTLEKSYNINKTCMLTLNTKIHSSVVMTKRGVKSNPAAAYIHSETI
mgnify:CR=1 FL=1